MKKRILIFSIVLTALGLTAFSLSNWNDTVTAVAETSNSESIVFNKPVPKDINDKVYPNFFYGIGTRFGAIKKEDVQKARSIADFLPTKQAAAIESYQSVKVILLEDDKHTEIRETGNSEMLTAAQIKLLQSMDYSTNILIRADYKEKNKETGELENSYTTPHLTIVPEKQAVYVSGKDALIDYLKENSKDKTAKAEEKKLQPAKLYFTVTAKGTISNVKIMRTSGYPSIDETMIDLITNAPGKWEPAENSKGEKVDQELVFSYGLMGC